MAQYKILLTRDTTESSILIVNADNLEEAQNKALEADHSNLFWELDEGNLGEAPYVADDEDEVIVDASKVKVLGPVNVPYENEDGTLLENQWEVEIAGQRAFMTSVEIAEVE